MLRALVLLSLIMIAVNAQLPKEFEPAIQQNGAVQRKLGKLVNIYGNPNPYEGPWPECIDWDGLTCKEYIDQWIGEDETFKNAGFQTHTHLINVNVWDFHRDRVWIQCDHKGNVLNEPSRG